jgi:hypothetical protein
MITLDECQLTLQFRQISHLLLLRSSSAYAMHLAQASIRMEETGCAR